MSHTSVQEENLTNFLSAYDVTSLLLENTFYLN
jgi:hypothetical protein